MVSGTTILGTGSVHAGIIGEWAVLYGCITTTKNLSVEALLSLDFASTYWGYHTLPIKIAILMLMHRFNSSTVNKDLTDHHKREYYYQILLVFWMLFWRYG